MKKNCLTCGKEFEVTKFRLTTAKYCSRKCIGKSVKRNCLLCGKEFEVIPSKIDKGGGKFCSKECMDKSRRKRVKRICQQCGKEFEIKQSVFNNGKGKFCSHQCQGKSSRNMVKTICKQCGKEFEVRRSKVRKFCSWECCRKVNRSRKVKTICKQCGKEFYVSPTQISKGWGKFCSKKCKGKSSRGKNSKVWKGKEVGYAGLHKWVRQNKPIPKTCEICGKVTTKLYAANISGKYKRDLNDFIYLCGPCHDKFDKQKLKYPNKDPELIIKELRKRYNK